MGNCLRRNKASMVWANDDDWESIDEPKEFPNREKPRLLGENFSSSSCSSALSEPRGREVKIKITKKQLRELLGNAQGPCSMPVEQVLSSLVDRSHDQFEIQHQRSWRPSLQSIPEVDQ